MYPLSIEKDLEKLFEKEFRLFLKEFTPKVLAGLKKSIQVADSADGHVIRYDVDVLEFLKKLNSQIPFDAKNIQQKIKNQLSLLAEFSKKIIVKKITENKNNLDVFKKFEAVDLLKTSDRLTAQIIESIAKENAGLIRQIKDQHVDAVRQVIQRGMLKGQSQAEIARAIAEIGVTDLNRARFWARDQAGSFYGKVAKVQQTSVGFTGYIWRGVRDAKLRDGHRDLLDQFFTWENPPLVGKRHLHPGEDFDCRCHAEPAYGPEDADRALDPWGMPMPAQPFESFNRMPSTNDIMKGQQTVDYAESGRGRTKRVNVSDTLELTGKMSKKERSIIEAGIQNIEKVIYAGEVMGKIPISYSARINGYGVFSYREIKTYPIALHTNIPKISISKFKPILEPKIILNRSAVMHYEKRMQSTSIHEWMHFLDRTFFEFDGSENNDGAMKDLFTTIEKSKAYKRMDKTLQDMKRLRVSNKTISNFKDNLLNRSEFFARAGTQYILTKAGNKEVLDIFKSEGIQYLSEIKKTKGLNKDAGRQWGKKDFEPILKEFDKLFAKVGILK